MLVVGHRDALARGGVLALDVGLELACLDPPLVASTHLNGGQVTGAHQGVCLHLRDAQQLLDVREGEESLGHAPIVACAVCHVEFSTGVVPCDRFGHDGRNRDRGNALTKTADAVAGRIRRPSWRDPRLLVGLALIAISVAAVVAIVQRADTTEPFYAAAHDLAPGTVLRPSDLVVVHVRVAAGEYVSPSDAVEGRVLERTVGAGELVPASALMDAAAYGARTIAVTSAMPLAEGVGVGSLVDVWVTAEDDLGAHSTLVGEDLPVTEVREAESGLGSRGGQTVYVAVPLGEVATVLAAVSTSDDVAIVAAGS